MLISIIIPIYNAEKYLRQCLDSIGSQSFLDWECILVDDGSKDSSPAICDEYAERDSRFKVIHKQNEGVSSARNIGLANATGEWIYFCDSDDKLHDENSLKGLLELSEHADLAVCSYVALDDNDYVFLRPDSPFIGDLNGKQYFYKRLESKLNLDYIGFLWAKLFRRDIKIRFSKDIKHAEDFLFVTQYVCSSDCRTIAVDNSRIIYDYYQHENSAMGKLNLQYNPAFFSDFILFISKTQRIRFRHIMRPIILKGKYDK